MTTQLTYDDVNGEWRCHLGGPGNVTLVATDVAAISHALEAISARMEDFDNVDFSEKQV